GLEAEVSAAVCFLLSPAASFITGACVRIDGGSLGAHREWPLASPHSKIPPFDGFHRTQIPELFNEG
ncbi:MAG TPA: hypothetical protein VGA69_00980, partial [Nitriliruptorales bacterium]